MYLGPKCLYKVCTFFVQACNTCFVVFSFFLAQQTSQQPPHDGIAGRWTVDAWDPAQMQFVYQK